MMQLSRNIREEKHDIFLGEMLREKAAVLTRAGVAVEQIIEQLRMLETEINEKISLMDMLPGRNGDNVLTENKRSFCEAVNQSIETFNIMRKKAETQYYYLIVTREALGLRRHEMVQSMYRIPEKKKKIETDG